MDTLELFNKNMRLVSLIFSQKFSTYESYKEDLIQEGYLALWKSCKGFDESKEIKFSTYACKAIYNQMLSYVKRVIQKHSSVLSLSTVVYNDESDLRLEEIISDSLNINYNLILSEYLSQVESLDKSIILKFCEGYTQDQVARQCGVSQATVSRCLQRFKKLLLEE